MRNANTHSSENILPSVTNRVPLVISYWHHYMKTRFAKLETEVEYFHLQKLEVIEEN